MKHTIVKHMWLKTMTERSSILQQLVGGGEAVFCGFVLILLIEWVFGKNTYLVNSVRLN